MKWRNKILNVMDSTYGPILVLDFMKPKKNSTTMV